MPERDPQDIIELQGGHQKFVSIGQNNHNGSNRCDLRSLYMHARHFLKHSFCPIIQIEPKVLAFFWKHFKFIRLYFRDDFQAKLLTPRT